MKVPGGQLFGKLELEAFKGFSQHFCKVWGSGGGGLDFCILYYLLIFDQPGLVKSFPMNCGWNRSQAAEVGDYVQQYVFLFQVAL